MRTTGSDDLYRLIHSLTTEEKGYFKKFAMRHGEKESKHLQLFDAINKQQEFEEAGLKKKFSDYAGMKVYLMDMILNALTVSMNKPQNPRIYLSMLLCRAAILERKALSQTSLTTVKKAQLVAAENSEYLFQWLFANRERDLMNLQLSGNERLSYNQEMENRLNQLAELQKNEDRFRFERIKLTLLLHKNQRQLPVQISEADIDFAYMQDEKNALSSRAQLERFDFWGEYYHHLQQHEKEYTLAKQYITTARNAADKAPRFLPILTRALLFAGRAAILTEHYAEVETHFTEMLEIKTGNGRFDKAKENTYVRFMLMYYCRSKQYLKGETFIQKTQLDYPAAYLPAKENNYYDSIIASAIFIFWKNKNYDKVIQYLNQFDNKMILFRSPIYIRDFEILRLILQFELGNLNLLPGLVISVIRQLKKQNLWGAHEKIVLSFFKAAHKPQLKKAAADAALQLSQISVSEFQSKLSSQFLGESELADWFKTISLTRGI